MTRVTGGGSGRRTAPAHRIGARELADLLLDWQPRRPGGGPGYQALAERLRLLVLDGRVPVDTLLPSERALAGAAGTSRTTTTAAYRLLREAGFADGHQGRGTWITLPGSADNAPPWPVVTGEAAAGAVCDLATAAFEAPPRLHAAYAAALADLPRYLPGHGYATAGVPALRAIIAQRYAARGVPTRPEEIIVTSGATQGLHLVLQALARRGDRAVVEHPTWPLGADTVRRAGLRPVAFAMEDGWDADRLAALVRRARPRLAYLMPDFHNPTGRLLDLAGRQAVAAVLRDAGCTMIADETTAELDLRAELSRGAELSPRAVSGPVPALAAVAAPGAVISIGSTSKTFWGGLRVGWVRAPEPLIRTLMQVRAAYDLAGPVLEQLTALHLLDQIDVLLPQRRQEAARRCTVLRSELAARLPSWTANLPDGGLALWVRLPAPRSSELVTAARALRVTLTPGSRFGVNGGFETRVRLPFTAPGPQLVRAVDLLAQAWSAGPGTSAGPGQGAGPDADPPVAV